ncbi:MAG: hypothetical protein LH615_04530 [Ferruginibacter sp.]|nr:hypothetical protein [Ferruginibacter sp.]
MSLDDIKFSPFLVKKLYKKSMIDSSFAKTNPIENLSTTSVKKTELQNEESLKKQDDVIKYLGKNDKHILILVNEPDHAFLGDDELSFLLTILNACSISMHDAALVNSHNNETVKYEKLMSQFSPSIILFLGIEPQQLGFPVQIPMYQVQQYNKQQYLCAPSLEILSKNKEEKKQLWLCLKKIFSIS